MANMTDFTYSSPTMVFTVGEEIVDSNYKAVSFMEDGTIHLAKAGECGLGLLPTSDDTLTKDTKVTVLVRGVGMLRVNSPVKAGDVITIKADGYGQKAETGDTIFGRAFSTGDANEVVQVDILPSGKY